MEFNFDATLFVQSGYENSDGEWNDADKSDIQRLRNLYPELSHWRDLAFGFAWGDYSQDIYAVSWADWIVERDNGFLAYIYVRSKRPGFKFGGTGLFDSDIWQFGEKEPWKSEAALPSAFM